VVDISQLHRIRATALGGPAEELHAQVALSVLAYVLDAEQVAPATREEAARAIAVGAETDLPTAMLRAVQVHAYAVRAAALRDDRDALLAELFVRSFQRILDVAESNSTNWSGRVLDLAAAHDHRYRAATPDGDPADLDEGIRLTEQVIEASAATQPPYCARTSSGPRCCSTATNTRPALTCTRPNNPSKRSST
jgi:hypothetical protein